MKSKKKGQEEMVGFGIIMVIVAVIALVFLALYLSRSSSDIREDYATASFVEGVLSYTTECHEPGKAFIDVRELIYFCNSAQKACALGIDCELLNETLRGLLEASWDVGANAAVKGVEMSITSESKEIFYYVEGNATAEYRGYFTEFPRRGEFLKIAFKAYS